MGAPATLYKQPSESRLFSFEFSANMSSGETISSITSVIAAPTGVTLGTPTASGTKVQVRISGGTNNTQYTITGIVVTSLGNILEGEGYLVVKDRL